MLDMQIATWRLGFCDHHTMPICMRNMLDTHIAALRLWFCDHQNHADLHLQHI